MPELWEDCTTLESQLRSLLRGKHASLTIAYNAHAASYCSVAAAIEWGIYDAEDFVSPEQKAAAVAVNGVWEIHWHPNTPIESYRILGASLDAVVAAALKGEGSGA